MTRTQSALVLIAPALLLLAGCYWLGVYVTHHGEPPLLWGMAKTMRGHALGLAWALTTAGRATVLAPLYALCLIATIFLRSWRTRLIYLVVCGLVAWRVTDAAQWLFARPRRLDWLLYHEHSFSYPSSHASISTAFYLLGGVLLLRSGLPAWVRTGAIALLAALWLGILWSRLSLAAHYPTDVVGGVCLGAGIVLLGAGLVRAAGGRLSEG